VQQGPDGEAALVGFDCVIFHLLSIGASFALLGANRQILPISNEPAAILHIVLSVNRDSVFNSDRAAVVKAARLAKRQPDYFLSGRAAILISD
jgi:hypothetical protein